MKRKRINEYYLSESRNRFLIAVILGMIAFLTLNCIFGNKIFWMILSFVGSFFISNIFSIIDMLRLRFSREKKEEKITVWKTIDPINRDCSWVELKEKRGFHLLVGDSGIGKSFLLNSLFKDSDNCYFKDNNYYLPFNEGRFEKKRVIVFDQFERAFPYLDTDRRRMIRSLASRPDTTVIVSLKTEALGQFCRLFGDLVVADRNSPKYNITWLKYKKEEEQALCERLSKSIAVSHPEKSALFKQVKSNMRSQKITFIQFSFINTILLKPEKTKHRYRENAENKQYDYDEMISGFLKEIIEEYKYADVAYQMMYLLSLDPKGEYFTGIKDFINITVQDEEIITSTLQFLEENELISKELDSGNTGSFDKINYECRHEYLCKLFKELSYDEKILKQGIRENIDYYHNKIQYKKEISDKPRIEDIYKKIKKQSDYLSSWKNQGFINVLYWILILLMIAQQALLFIPGLSEKIEPQLLHFWDMISYYDVIHSMKQAYLLMIFVNAAVGLSIFYIYNIYKDFYHALYYQNKRLTRGICWCVIIGSVGCVCAYIFLPYWAVWLGLEVLLIGLCNIGIRKNVRSEEKVYFGKLFRNTCFSSLAIIGLGIWFQWFIVSDIWLSVPFFCLYIIFMGLCVINHINRQNMLSLTGKVLYRTERKISGKTE